MSDPRIEICAEAMWEHRANESLGNGALRWSEQSWPEFCTAKPDIAAIYRDNAIVILGALDNSKN